MREQQRAAGREAAIRRPLARFERKTPPAGREAGGAPEEPAGWRGHVQRSGQGPDHRANSELDDLVLVRADGVPTYNFGVVIDDLDMNITHVIRGDDHVNNTPRQINILRALGAPLPHMRMCR